MKVSEIFDIEKENHASCFLIKDGVFWRSYEKSAMYFIKQIKEYTLTKKYFKNINFEMVYLGFPGKILPEICEISKRKGLTISSGDNIIEISGFETLNDFIDWKAGVTSYKTENDSVIANDSKMDYEKNLIDKIRKFPIAERTPIECQKFIAELQHTINGTI